MSFAPALPLPLPLPFLPPRIPGGLIADPALRALTRADVIAYWAHVLRVSAGQWFPKPPATPLFLVGPTLAALAGILLFPQRTADGTLPDAPWLLPSSGLDPGLEPPPVDPYATRVYTIYGPDNPDGINRSFKIIAEHDTGKIERYDSQGSLTYEYPAEKVLNQYFLSSKSAIQLRDAPKNNQWFRESGKSTRGWFFEGRTETDEGWTEWEELWETDLLLYNRDESSIPRRLAASPQTVTVNGDSQPITPDPLRQPKPRPTPIIPQPLTTTMRFPGAPIPGPGPAPVPINPTPVQPGPTPAPASAPVPAPFPLPSTAPAPAPVPLKVTPTLPSGVPVPPAPAPVVPTPGNVHFPVPGLPGVSPAGAKASVAAMAKEVGRIEQKQARALNNGKSLLDQLGDLANLIPLLSLLQDLLEKPYPTATYSIQGVCEEVSEDDPQQPQTDLILPEQKWADRLIETPAILETLLQAHLGYKTPVCASTNGKPKLEGDWVTLRFESDEPSPNSNRVVRKLLRYRSKSGAELGAITDYWRGFTWTTGSVSVQHADAWWGTPQVWAVSADEGKRVLRHVAREAGIDPDKAGRWIISGSRNPRYGVSLPVKLKDLDGGPWVTQRDTPSGPAEINR